MSWSISKVTSTRSLYSHLKKYVHKRASLTKTVNPFPSEITEIIDVRSPKEFEADHIPGAINLPVLHNDEHEQVGKQYHLNSFKARAQGAGLVCHNIGNYMSSYFCDKQKDYRPFIYCLRGGQRSASLAIILSQVGYDVKVLEGGYKTYRKEVLRLMKELPDHFQYRVIAGLTGSGKTFLLSKLAEQGEQILDLEALAKHKGSVLGLWHNEKQPTQRQFESYIIEKLKSFKEDKVVWLESESHRIGNLNLPPTIFKKICESKRYVVSLPLAERVEFIIKDYHYFLEDFNLVKENLQHLKKVHSSKIIQNWISLGEEGRWKELVESLLVNHYDPTYTASQKKNNHTNKTIDVNIKNLGTECVNRCLKHLVEDSRETQ